MPISDDCQAPKTTPRRCAALLLVALCTWAAAPGSEAVPFRRSAHHQNRAQTRIGQQRTELLEAGVRHEHRRMGRTSMTSAVDEQRRAMLGLLASGGDDGGGSPGGSTDDRPPNIRLTLSKLWNDYVSSVGAIDANMNTLALPSAETHTSKKVTFFGSDFKGVRSMADLRQALPNKKVLGARRALVDSFTDFDLKQDSGDNIISNVVVEGQENKPPPFIYSSGFHYDGSLNNPDNSYGFDFVALLFHAPSKVYNKVTVGGRWGKQPGSKSTDSTLPPFPPGISANASYMVVRSRCNLNVQRDWIKETLFEGNLFFSYREAGVPSTGMLQGVTDKNGNDPLVMPAKTITLEGHDDDTTGNEECIAVIFSFTHMEIIDNSAQKEWEKYTMSVVPKVELVFENTCEITCEHGEANLYTCECDCQPNWKGERCDTCDAVGLQSFCQEPGTDKIDNTTCTCTCMEHWYGRKCDQCSIDCGQNGEANDACVCECDHEYWLGEVCDKCVLGAAVPKDKGHVVDEDACSATCAGRWKGTTCEECPVQCGLHGTRDGECDGCTCDWGWASSDPENLFFCDECALVEIDCHGGKLNQDTCRCNECPGHFGGDDCSTCAADSFSCGVSETQGTKDLENCVCVCAGHWTGLECGVCEPGCGEHGTPSSADGVCSCACEEGYEGELCDDAVTPGLKVIQGQPNTPLDVDAGEVDNSPRQRLRVAAAAVAVAQGGDDHHGSGPLACDELSVAGTVACFDFNVDSRTLLKVSELATAAGGSDVPALRASTGGTFVDVDGDGEEAGQSRIVFQPSMEGMKVDLPGDHDATYALHVQADPSDFVAGSEGACVVLLGIDKAGLVMHAGRLSIGVCDPDGGMSSGTDDGVAFTKAPLAVQVVVRGATDSLTVFVNGHEIFAHSGDGVGAALAEGTQDHQIELLREPGGGTGATGRVRVGSLLLFNRALTNAELGVVTAWGRGVDLDWIVRLRNVGSRGVTVPCAFAATGQANGVAMWFRVASVGPGGGGTVIGRPGGPLLTIQRRQDDSFDLKSCTPTSAGAPSCSETVPDVAGIGNGDWHHIVVSHQSNGQRVVFVDGTLNDALSGNAVDSAQMGGRTIQLGGGAIKDGMTLQVGNVVVRVDGAFSAADAELLFALGKPEINMRPVTANCLSLGGAGVGSGAQHVPDATATDLMGGSGGDGFAAALWVWPRALASKKQTIVLARGRVRVASAKLEVAPLVYLLRDGAGGSNGGQTVVQACATPSRGATGNKCVEALVKGDPLAWHHLAVTLEGGKLTVYADGEAGATIELSGPGDNAVQDVSGGKSGNLYVGSWAPLLASALGQDYAALEGVAATLHVQGSLSADQIRALHDEGPPAACEHAPHDLGGSSSLLLSRTALDGTHMVVRDGGGAASDGFQDVSVAVWLRPVESGREMPVLSLGRPGREGDSNAVTLRVSALDQVVVEVKTTCDGDDGILTEGPTIDATVDTSGPHRWTHVAALVSGRALHVLVDGQLVEQRDLGNGCSIRHGPEAVTIGWGPCTVADLCPEGFRGMLGDVRVANSGGAKAGKIDALSSIVKDLVSMGPPLALPRGLVYLSDFEHQTLASADVESDKLVVPVSAESLTSSGTGASEDGIKWVEAVDGSRGAPSALDLSSLTAGGLGVAVPVSDETNPAYSIVMRVALEHLGVSDGPSTDSDATCMGLIDPAPGHAELKRGVLSCGSGGALSVVSDSSSIGPSLVDSGVASLPHDMRPHTIVISVSGGNGRLWVDPDPAAAAARGTTEKDIVQRDKAVRLAEEKLAVFNRRAKGKLIALQVYTRQLSQADVAAAAAFLSTPRFGLRATGSGKSYGNSGGGGVVASGRGLAFWLSTSSVSTDDEGAGDMLLFKHGGYTVRIVARNGEFGSGKLVSCLETSDSDNSPVCIEHDLDKGNESRELVFFAELLSFDAERQTHVREIVVSGHDVHTEDVIGVPVVSKGAIAAGDSVCKFYYGELDVPLQDARGLVELIGESDAGCSNVEST